MNGLLFGSIGSLVETSENQREAFNRAFREHGLDWQWDRDDYRNRLVASGGRHRIAEYAKERGESVDAAAIHQTKSRIFQQALREGEMQLRDGVMDVIEFARENDIRLGLVTTTSRENVDSMLEAVARSIPADTFEVIVDATLVQETKPDGECYRIALRGLGLQADECLAIEDNVDGVRAAKEVGISCIAFPGQNTVDHDYEVADIVTDNLFKTVQQMLRSTEDATV